MAAKRPDGVGMGHSKPQLTVSTKKITPPFPPRHWNTRTEATVAIDVGSAEKRTVYRSSDGEVLPPLSGWLRKKSRKRGAWNRRHFHIDAEQKRLYYLQKVPSEMDVDCSTGGMFSTLAKAVAFTYHKIVDGENQSESWVDLRLVPDVDHVYLGRSGKMDPLRFDIDLGYRKMKLKADNEAQCVEWVEGLNKWREWALTTGHGNEEPYSATGRNPFSGYSTEDSNSQRGDSVTSSLGMSDSEPSTPDRVLDRVSRPYNEGPRKRQPSGKQRKAAARRYPSRDSSQSSFDSLDYTPNSSRLKDSTPPRGQSFDSTESQGYYNAGSSGRGRGRGGRGGRGSKGSSSSSSGRSGSSRGSGGKENEDDASNASWASARTADSDYDTAASRSRDGTPTGDPYSGSDWDSHESSDSQGSVTPPRRDLSRKALERAANEEEEETPRGLVAEQAEDEALLELRLGRSILDDEEQNDSGDAHLSMTAAVSGDVVMLHETLLDPPPRTPVEASADASLADASSATKPEAEAKPVVLRKPRLPPPLTHRDDETVEREEDARELPIVEKPKRRSKAKKKGIQRSLRPPREPPSDNDLPLQKPARALRPTSPAHSTEALEDVLPKLLLSQVTRLPRPDSASPATAPELGQLAARWTDYPTQLTDDTGAASADKVEGASSPSNAGVDSISQLDV